MYVNPFQISLETLMGVSPMLGHRLEDRSRIRESQDSNLIQSWQAASTVRLRDPDQRSLFCVAPLDIMVTEKAGEKSFHVLELNGTGIGGLTNISGQAVSCVLDDLCALPQKWTEPEPLVLVAVSGKESDPKPRLNRMIYEKILYVEALKRGFDFERREVEILTLPHLKSQPGLLRNGKPTIVLGYTKEFVEAVELDIHGRITLFDRTVSAAINDRFCLNVMQKFANRVDMRTFQPINGCYLAGADKGVAYGLLNEYLSSNRHRYLPSRVLFRRAHHRETLIRTVVDWVRRGRATVIKPRGTGLGHGIAFFLDARESVNAITAKIDESLAQTEQWYGLPGGALPYTVCEFLDACTIRDAEHRFHGHRYELRVVVYREGMFLKAFPSIAKVSCKAYDPNEADHQSLINNITASTTATHTDGTEHMLPLANLETLETLGLTPRHLQELCAFATRWVRHILNRVHDSPEEFGIALRESSVEAWPGG